jgi:hypothetical protein
LCRQNTGQRHLGLRAAAPSAVPDRRSAASDQSSRLATGTVESLGLGYTKIRTEDGKLVIIPNSAMATQVTLNMNEAAPSGRQTG